jgi:ATP synthase protein I
MGAYVVKIVGLGLLVFGLGAPDWIDGPWFLASGVATVVLWQGTEVYAFSKTRFQVFADPDNSQGGTHAR